MVFHKYPIVLLMCFHFLKTFVESNNEGYRGIMADTAWKYIQRGLKNEQNMNVDALVSQILSSSRTKRSLSWLPPGCHTNKSIPAAVNYTRFFPPVKHQGTCLSCWAFAAVSVLEFFALKRGRNVSFSEQNLVDCSTKNYGCNGGWPTTAFNYIKDEGISSGKSYRYKGHKQECQRKGSKYRSILKIPNVCEVFLNGREDLLKKLIALYGPVAGAMSTTDNFTRYKSGVFKDIRCQNHTVDHAITIVGYGTHATHGDFWIIRNSWSRDWGQNGYGWVARNKDNTCGIALYAIFPCEK